MTNNSPQQQRQQNQNVVKTGSWLPVENARLRDAVAKHGTRWVRVAREVGSRTGDQCAKRWNENLNPELDHSPWTAEEDDRLLAMVKTYGRNWKFIAENILELRAPLALKNRYSLLMRRLNRQEQGFKTAPYNASSSPGSGSGSPSPGSTADLTHFFGGQAPDFTTVNITGSSFPLQFGSNFGSTTPWPATAPTSSTTTLTPTTTISTAWDSPKMLWQHPYPGTNTLLPNNNNNSSSSNTFESDPEPEILTPTSDLSSTSTSISSRSLTRSQSSSTSTDGEVEYAVTCQWGKVKTLMNYLVDAAMSESAAWTGEDDQITVTLRLKV